MNATEWKQIGRGLAEAAAEDLELPSGMVIRARRPDPLQIAMWGSLPLALTGEVQRDPDSEKPAPGIKEILANIELSRQVLLYCCVSPRISLEPAGDDEIHPRDVPLEDATFLLRWAMRRKEADDLRRFRQNGEFPGVGANGQNIQSETIGDAGDPGSHAGAGDRPGGGDGDHQRTTPTPRLRRS